MKHKKFRQVQKGNARLKIKSVSARSSRRLLNPQASHLCNKRNLSLCDGFETAWFWLHLSSLGFVLVVNDQDWRFRRWIIRVKSSWMESFVVWHNDFGLVSGQAKASCMGIRMNEAKNFVMESSSLTVIDCLDAD